MAVRRNALAAASEQTRGELLDAGLRLLLQLPASAVFGHLTVNRIAAEAGRTSGAFFHQWSSMDDYLDDFIGYVLQPSRAVNLEQAVRQLMAGVAGGASFADSLLDAGRDVPARAAGDPQTIIELLIWNRALHDEDFRARAARHYAALDDNASRVFGELMQLLQREPRPPFTPEIVGAILNALTEGLALREYLSPGFYPDGVFGLIVNALAPLLSRTPDDPRDAASYVRELPLTAES